jgi:hypothetical protein
MVDLWTTWHLLQTARLVGVHHIVCFGDPQQLSPVDGRGTILDAFMGTACVTNLSTNYRATPGLLSLMDHLRSVALGTTRLFQPAWFETTNSRLCVVPNDNPAELYASILCQLHQTDPAETRIIVGRKAPIIDRGTMSSTGREAFLLDVHNFFNPGTDRTRIEFRHGDLIRSSVNITEENGGKLVVANGSEGTVVSVEPLVVRFHGRLFEHAIENVPSVQRMFEKLEWGSISTVHKFQGSEAHTIIAVFLGDFVDHNTIQLLYTAASRAKQRLIVIMEEKNLSLFCTRPGRVPRNTRFNQKLQKALAL